MQWHANYVHGFQDDEFSISCKFHSKSKQAHSLSQADLRIGLNQNKRPYQNKFPFQLLSSFLFLPLHCIFGSFVQSAHCALALFMVVSLSEQFFRRRQDARPVSSDCCKTRTSCTPFRSVQNIFAIFHFIARTILVKCIMIHLNDIFGAFKGLLCLQFLRHTDGDPIIGLY